MCSREVTTHGQCVGEKYHGQKDKLIKNEKHASNDEWMNKIITSISELYVDKENHKQKGILEKHLMTGNYNIMILFI